MTSTTDPPPPSQAILALQNLVLRPPTMLLLHQTGSVKIGEIVRYTITYTPAQDRILPAPTHLHLKIKNTTAVALRAAFIHGPYTLYAAAYPATFHPDQKFENPRIYGVPEFEPNLKAGGSFSARLNVPEDIRSTAGIADSHGRSPGREDEIRGVSWVVEVTSQVIFSMSAAVHYEILLGRDEKSVSLGFASSLTGQGGGGSASVPGHVSDHQQSAGGREGGRHHGQPKGVFSRAIKLKVEDTASLWNTPRMPEWNDEGNERGALGRDRTVESVLGGGGGNAGHRQKRQKKVHLVVLTHGLHSNLGADMLYLKESIDAAAKEAKIDARARRTRKKQEERGGAWEAGQAPGGERKDGHGEAKREENLDDEDDEEEVIVRGFSGNAVRTEKGIKYLGKRLAKYVLQMTYPDQPFKPTMKKSAVEALSHAIRPDPVHVQNEDDGEPAHKDSTILKEPYSDKKLAYKITSISFIAHSLGGLIQTYAIAYIQKHSPEFFDKIKPINFIAMASPFLGLSNENPLYVKFALDFGLVGRTGQDLGLTWRAPTIARSGWGAIVGGLGESASKKTRGETAPESKPLLRILPTGPAHIVLKKFRNRTVYSNVVNDGIVPLRTSCLLFLDWQGLGRVEKARRENGLVGTMVQWGWAEATGANSSSPARLEFPEGALSDSEEMGINTPTRQGHGGDVPQPPPSATQEDNAQSLKGDVDKNHPITAPSSPGGSDAASLASQSETSNNNGPLANILKFFQPTPTSNPKSHNHTSKSNKIYKRSQTLKIDSSNTSNPSISKQKPTPKKLNGRATTGDVEHDDSQQLSAPPKTTFFESAGDLLKPPLPSVQFLVDPSSRPRTIFHDRVYHPADIPPPPLKKRSTSFLRRCDSTSFRPNTSISSPTSSPTIGIPHTDSILSAKDYDDTIHTNPGKDPRDVVDGSAMKVEEKIARAYHRDLSWRKVLVRLEPDAHNNMVVRRMFANAYGWPVIKHLVDTHFSDGAAAMTRDEDEGIEERVKGVEEAPGSDGGETKESSGTGTGTGGWEGEDIKMLSKVDRSDSERKEATDEVPALRDPTSSTGNYLEVPGGKKIQYDKGMESDTQWSERDWADSEADSDEEVKSPAARSVSGGRSPSSWGGRVSSTGWNINWTEKIVGKGASGRARSASPASTGREESETFLSSGRQVVGSPVSDGEMELWKGKGRARS